MAKVFGFDPSKGWKGRLGNMPAPVSTKSVRRRQPQNDQTPGLPPVVRGLPWSKMLRSFREKSA